MARNKASCLAFLVGPCHVALPLPPFGFRVWGLGFGGTAAVDSLSSPWCPGSTSVRLLSLQGVKSCALRVLGVYPGLDALIEIFLSSPIVKQF